MEEEKLRAIKRNLMGSLEEDFEDNLDDIDESDLDEFLMNTDEQQVKTSEEEKEEKKEISNPEEDSSAKDDESKDEEEKTENQQEEETKGEKDGEEEEEERKEEKERNEQRGDSTQWTCKGRSITSPQVFLPQTTFPFRILSF